MANVLKFELDTSQSGLLIRAYAADHLVIGDTRYAGPLVVMPTEVLTDVLPALFGELNQAHLLRLAERGAEVIVVGSGTRQVFLDFAVVGAMAKVGIGVEVMSTAAACRCYNVLASEGRAVAAIMYLGLV